MRQFSVIERMKVKLQIMSFMSTFDECLKMVKPQVDTVAVAAKSLRHSKKMKEWFPVFPILTIFNSRLFLFPLWIS